MVKALKSIVLALVAAAIVTATALYLHGVNVAVLNPKGPIARSELHLIIIVCLLMLIIAIPVFVMLAVIAWRYREGNATATYTPEWDGNRVAETIWWVVPTVLIGILSVITWNSTHQLDPYRPIASNNPPITIQAVAMDWKWLFIYPEQHIASVNLVQIPMNTPVNFQITSDAPMNSFWIPQLGGQIYAMAGMSSQLHLMADQTGDFRGSSANISGSGFARMTFTARSSSKVAFDQWVMAAQKSPQQLTGDAYNQLAKPSQNSPAALYSGASSNLYHETIMKYMPSMPGMDMNGMSMDSMDMSETSAQ